MHLTDTILATSSPPTGGGVRAILRLSGPRAWSLVNTLVQLPASPNPGHHGPLALPLLHPILKVASVLLFKAPRSFTGEDIAELHLPNSPALLRACIDQLLHQSAGDARLAGPGEFSARAFFNNKIDLTEAEGIAATINATSELELKAAASLRQGHLHKEIDGIANDIAEMLAMVEAGIDFSDEESVSYSVTDANILNGYSQLPMGLQYMLTSGVRVDRTNTLPTVVFIGQPNVGKSSLVNALSGKSRSIISPIAGTTRDVLSATMTTPFGDVRIIDVPGEEQPLDELRQKMMQARENALFEADLIIEVLTDEEHVISGLANSFKYGTDLYTVQNKVDLLPPEELYTECYEDGMCIPLRGQWQMVSAKTGHNIELLRHEIGRSVYRKPTIGPHIPALNQRHRAILQQCKSAVLQADEFIDYETNQIDRPELLAADLRRALDLLGQITGAISPDDILGRVFARFCIGK